MIFKFSEFSQFASMSFLYNREEVIYKNGDTAECPAGPLWARAEWGARRPSLAGRLSQPLGPLSRPLPRRVWEGAAQRAREWNVCLARGRAGRSGFRKVGAPAERTACADRGPGGLGGLAPHPEGHGLGCSEEQR